MTQTNISYEDAILKLKEVIQKSNGSNKPADSFQLSTLFFSAVQDLDVSSRQSQDSIIFANANISILEDVFNLKSSVLSIISCQQIFISFLQHIYKKAPGYAMRNFLAILMAIIKNKNTASTQRECAVLALGCIANQRCQECGNMLLEIFQILYKLCKGNDIQLKISSLKALTRIVASAKDRLNVYHPDVCRLISKNLADKSIAIRLICARLTFSLASVSSHFSTLSPDTLMAVMTKGLEDECVETQSQYATAFATLLLEQILVYSEEQDQAKIGLARSSDAGIGTRSPNSSEKRKSTGSSNTSGQTLQERMKNSLSSTKKYFDSYDFTSIMKGLIKYVGKSTGTLRNGYFSVLGHLIRESMSVLKDVDLDMLLDSIMSMFSDILVVNITNEESVYFRTRVAYILRTSITDQLNEAQLFSWATVLCNFVSQLDQRTDIELMVAMTELSHVISCLNQAVIGCTDDIQASVTVHLNHPSFNVRTSAASCLYRIGLAAPGAASMILRASFLQTQSIAKALLMLDSVLRSTESNPQVNSRPKSSSIDAISSEFNSFDDEDNTHMMVHSPRSATSITDKNQRMYTFHGHAMVVSYMMKSIKSIPLGLPNQIIFDIFDFGMILLLYDMTVLPMPERHIACSLVRSGGVLIASCIHAGAELSQFRIKEVLQVCKTLFTRADNFVDNSLVHASPEDALAAASFSAKTTAGSTVAAAGSAALASNSNASSDEMLFELMGLEAAILCFSTVLWHCPDIFQINSSALPSITESLEIGYRVIKGKYQPKYKGHFRFRTLMAAFMECFSWLPPGSYPPCYHHLYIESLRLYRDGFSQGVECTCISDYLHADSIILNLSTLATTSGANIRNITSNMQTPTSEEKLVLKLESYLPSMQKKESEALFTSFETEFQHWVDREVEVIGQQFQNSNYRKANILAESTNKVRVPYVESIRWQSPHSPCSQIDVRLLNASIMLAGTTFGFQTKEYQDKAVQLALFAFAQISKSSLNSTNLSIFSSDEDKRRRERKVLVTIKNVTALLSRIIENFPYWHGELSKYIQWAEFFIEPLIEASTTINVEIRAVASKSLAVLAGHITWSTTMIDRVFSTVSTSLNSMADKKVEVPLEGAGHMLTLGMLWLESSNFEAIQSTIVVVLLEWLRRVEYSALFRSNGMFSLGCIIEKMISSIERHEELNSLFDRIIQTIDTHFMSIHNCDELEIVLVTLQRVIRITITAMLRYTSTRSITDETRFFHLIQKLLLYWDDIIQINKNGPQSFAIDSESYNLFSSLFQFSAILKCVDSTRIHELVTTMKLSLQHHLSIATAHIVLKVCRGFVFLSQLAPQIVRQMKCEVPLYNVLCWSTSRSLMPTTQAYQGLDTCSLSSLLNPLPQINVIKQIAHYAEVALLSQAYYISNVESHRPNCAMNSFLFHRSVALALRATNYNHDLDDATPGGEDADGVEERADDDDNDNTLKVSKFPAKNLLASGVNSTSATLTYQQYVAHCKDQATQAATGVEFVNIHVKYVAVRCMFISVQHLKQLRVTDAHRNIQLARTATQLKLEAFCITAANVTNSLQSNDIPCFASLFIHDLVNTACSVATYTFNEKPSIILQIASINLLDLILQLFASTQDPDAQVASSNTDQTHFILHQFISQITSALRPCLSHRLVPELTLSCSSIINRLLRENYVVDKISIRRLLKLLLPTIEERAMKMKVDVTSESPTDDELVVINHFVSVCSTAELYLTLSYDAIYPETNSKASTSKKVLETTIAELILKHKSSWADTWYSFIVDTARFLLYVKGISPVKVDPSLGGSSYAPFLQCTRIREMFTRHLPTFIAASSLLDTLKPQQLQTIFAVIQALIIEFDHYKSNVDYNLNKDTVAIVIKSFIHDQSYFTNLLIALDRISTNRKINTIGLSSWTFLLQKLPKFLCNSLVNDPLSEAFVINLHWTLAVYKTFTVEVLSSKNSLSDTIFSCIWIGTQTVCLKLFPQLYCDNGVDSVGIQNIILSGKSAPLVSFPRVSAATKHTTNVAIVSNGQSNHNHEANDDDFGSFASFNSFQPVTHAILQPSAIATASSASELFQEAIVRDEFGHTFDVSQISIECKVQRLFGNLIAVLHFLATYEKSYQPYIIKLLISIMQQLSVVQTIDARSENTSNNAVNSICSLTSVALGSQPNGKVAVLGPSDVCFLLMSSLCRYSQHFTTHSKIVSSTTSTWFDSGLASLGLIQWTIAVWIQCCVQGKDEKKIANYAEAFGTIIGNRFCLPSFKKAMLSEIRSILQIHRASTIICSPILAVLVPVIINTLTTEFHLTALSDSQKSLIDEYELTCIQILFLGFAVVTDTTKGPYMSLIFNSLCLTVSRHSHQLDSAIIQFMGKGFTGLAQSSPDLFKAQLGQVTDTTRQTLQLVMKHIIMQQQQQVQQHQHQSSSFQTAANIQTAQLTLDINKFKTGGGGAK